MNQRLSRTVRRIVAILAVPGLLWVAGCSGKGDEAPRVLVLGIDGLDPVLLQQFVDEGVMPHFARLIDKGEFKPLQTSMPPLSPIAWSTFITGMDPGGHGVFDFVHRDPETVMPYNAMSRAVPPARQLEFGSWVIPLGSGKVENLRRGPAFWQILEERGVPTTVFRMPANFPPADSPGQAFSGMGTPDIQGTPGTFSYYTDLPVPNADDIAGGKVYLVEVVDHHVRAEIYGPENPFRRFPREDRRSRPGDEVKYEHPDLTVEFDVYLDPEEPVARFVVQDEEFILEEGEWSPWVSVRFNPVPLPIGDTFSAIGRFYLKQARPDFQLYLTPLQINPEDPAMPLSTPDGWARELFGELGPFYTQELPEDTKALTHEIFTGRDFWEQSQFVYRERRRALDFFLDRFEEGMLFFYFSSVDQGCHMLWRYGDPEHPGFQEDNQLIEGIRIRSREMDRALGRATPETEEDSKLLGGIRTLYREMDEALGRIYQAIDEDTTLIVMSDHGFCPFYWEVNLNTWLLEKGYVTLKDPSRQGLYPLFLNVDWSRTRAYAVGLNGLYVNLMGREKNGIVMPGEEYERLLGQLEQDLLEMRDPRNGRQVVTLVTRTHRDFHGPYLDVGPDIIVGYNWGYRVSWKSPLGEFPREVIQDNIDAWSGDHSVDYRVVPGVLLTNRRITLDEPALYDLTVAILDEYGVEKPDGLIGTDCLGARIDLRTIGKTEKGE